MAIAVRSLEFLDGAKEPLGHRLSLWIRKDWGTWQIIDSSFNDYVARIATVREKIPVKTIIATHLEESENRVGLDIAGGVSGRALRQLVNRGLLDKGLVTNYDDNRSFSEKQDSRLGHVDGNLTNANTWQRILDWQRQNAPEGFGFVMHRPVGGLQELQPEFYAGATCLVLDMMSSSGMFYTQIPESLVTNNVAKKKVWRELKSRGDIAAAWLATTDGGKMHSNNAHALIIKR